MPIRQKSVSTPHSSRPTLVSEEGTEFAVRGRNDLKITSVKTAATTGHCMHLWVKITTDAGITGIGECVHGGYQAIAIIKELEERLIGRDPFAIDAIFEETRRFAGVRGRLCRRADHRAHRHRDRAVGPQGQGPEGADLRTDGRQVPRRHPRLLRLRSLARHEHGRGAGRRRRGAGSRLHRAQGRPRHPRLRPYRHGDRLVRQGQVQHDSQQVGA